MTITKLKDFDYEVIDPKTKGRWLVTSHLSLSYYGVMYSIMGALINEGVRPGEGTTTTVVFNFVIEGDENQKSKAQKLFESLID